MTAYIAKHYWKDGESSTWECHKKIDKQLFEYFKENYHRFAVEKPIMIKKLKQFIYLCYEDNTDTYGRSITNITFFVLHKKVAHHFCNEVEIRNLELLIPEQEVIKSNKLWIAMMVVILIAIVFMWKNELVEGISSKNSPNKENNKKEKIIDYTDFIKNWNKQIVNNADNADFKLSDNNKTVITELNSIFSDLNITFDKNANVDSIKSKLATYLKTKNNMSDIVDKVLMRIEVWKEKKNREN